MKTQFTKTIWRTNVILALSIALTFVFTNGLYAQHKEGDKENSKEHNEGELEHKNHVALFTGATTNFDENTTQFSIGMDYEHKISKLFGIGLLGEYIAGESSEILVGIPVFIHPVGELKFVIAPLMVWAKEPSGEDETDEPEGISEEESKMEQEFAVRVGVGYEFHIGKLSVGPEVNFDIGNKTAVVYGLSFGMGF